ncbi:adenosylcobinamide-GDP ribazoletransferase [Thalassotalea sediminis]|uniref:adenosylcobinamide-GDP ribazoletransferase n=1 Tax=Thalassotalea sediminis TaxID=1759089 RepID=UPI002573D746|nr:adenosylcobinamide-GDP ribazoletransferase [Thalassotalea sediminis]
MSLAFVTRQWRMFRMACQFFTRIPVGNISHFQASELNKATRYFSLVGLLVGTILFAFYLMFSLFLPVNVAIVLIMIVGTLLTGAFHEDGLADMADGMGGGFTVEAKLAIMKDSRLGTYGAITLFLALMLKFTLLTQIADTAFMAFALLFAHGFSRGIAASLIISTPYVSEEKGSKSKPLAQQQGLLDCLIVLVVGVLPLILLPETLANLGFIMTMFGVLWLFRVLFRQWLTLRLGGFTGDCLGACQQIAELFIYLIIVAFTMGGNT